MKAEKYSLIYVVLVSLFFTVNISIAGEKLSKEKVIALFSDKTYDGFSKKKNRKYRVYDSPDGSHKIVYADGRVKNRFWKVDDNGMLCISKRKAKKGGCKAILSVGNGVYHKIKDDGTVRQILSNIVEGNQL